MHDTVMPVSLFSPIVTVQEEDGEYLLHEEGILSSDEQLAEFPHSVELFRDEFLRQYNERSKE